MFTSLATVPTNKPYIDALNLHCKLRNEYGAVSGPIQVSALNRVQKRAAKFANQTNESGWETLAQRRMIARICALFKAYTRKRAWKAIGDRLLKPCYLGREDHGWKIRTRKQRTDVGKHSFGNGTIKS
jgi:hypothetical protein